MVYYLWKAQVFYDIFIFDWKAFDLIFEIYATICPK